MFKIFDKQTVAGSLDFAALIDTLCRNDVANAFAIKKQRRFSYFAEYFQQCDAKCVVLEEQYVDRDYIQDYSRYYSLCFSEYPKFSTRCHFFSKAYKQEDIENIVLNGKAGQFAALNESYLGFFVFRPLPIVAFGRTCLNLPSTFKGDKVSKVDCMKAIGTIDVCFFGIKLKVIGVSFQEQDLNVSACATSALWSAFQVTRNRFGHCACSPSAITSLANPDVSFPHHGLTVGQMIHAISQVGLGTYWASASSVEIGFTNASVKAIVSPYLDFGLPVVLIGRLDQKEVDSSSKVKWKALGFHAITLCGYRFDPHHKLVPGDMNVYMMSDGIDELIGCDDQVGPYCRLSEAENSVGASHRWCTQWGFGASYPTDDVVFNVTNILVPLYRKIRVSYEDVRKISSVFIRYVQSALDDEPDNVIKMAQWDFQLMNCDDFKSIVRDSGDYSDTSKKTILLSSTPKYIWTVSVYLTKTPLLTFILDATDISHGVHVMYAIRRGEIFKDLILKLQAEPDFGMHPFTVAYNTTLLTYS